MDVGRPLKEVICFQKDSSLWFTRIDNFTTSRSPKQRPQRVWKWRCWSVAYNAGVFVSSFWKPLESTTDFTSSCKVGSSDSWSPSQNKQFSLKPQCYSKEKLYNLVAYLPQADMNAVNLNFIAGPRSALNSWRMQAFCAIKPPSSGTPKSEILYIQGNSGVKFSILEGYIIGNLYSTRRGLFLLAHWTWNWGRS